MLYTIWKDAEQYEDHFPHYYSGWKFMCKIQCLDQKSTSEQESYLRQVAWAKSQTKTYVITIVLCQFVFLLNCCIEKGNG